MAEDLQEQKKQDEDRVRHRATRMGYRNLNKEIFVDADKLEDVDDNDALEGTLKKLSNLVKNVDRTREGVQDTTAFKMVTGMTKKRVDKLGANKKFHISDLLKKIKQKYRQSTGEDDDENEETAIDWNKLYSSAKLLFMNYPPNMDFMMGPLKYVPPKRNTGPRQKRVLDLPKGPATTAEEVDEIEDHQAYTTQLTKEIYTLMFDVNRPVSLWELLVDPTSYSHTIENLFAYACLARDGKVDLKVVDGQPMTSAIVEKNNKDETAAAAAAAAAAMQSTNQFVMAMDFLRYQKIVQQNNIKRCLVPPREAEAHNTVYRTKDGATTGGNQTPAKPAPAAGSSKAAAGTPKAGGSQAPAAVRVKAEKRSAEPVAAGTKRSRIQ